MLKLKPMAYSIAALRLSNGTSSLIGFDSSRPVGRVFA
jgi:hypothetical protein